MMKRLINILLAVLMIAILASCNSTKPATLKNEIAPSELTAEQQEIIDLLAVPNSQQLMIFNYNTEDAYRSIEVWVKIYQDGELIDRPAGIVLSSDTAEKRNGRLAIIINQDNSSYQWTLSLIQNDGKSSHVGTREMPFDSDARFANAYSPMDDAENIEDGKEIIIYKSLFAEADVPLQAFDHQTLQERPELLNEYPYAQLITCKFSK